MPSQIASPLVREEVEIDGRHMHAARRARVLARDKHCRYPGCEVTDGLEVDHIIALELGGRDRDDNLQCLCGPHHRQKTAIDAGLIAKAKRRKAKADGSFPPSKAKLRGRGFQRTRPELP
jgi:5-methylcytosine-specific restriction enzyme A